MLADPPHERRSLAQPQAFDAQLEDAADHRRRTEHIRFVARQLPLRIFRQQSRIAVVASRPGSQPVDRLQHEVNLASAVNPCPKRTSISIISSVFH